MIDYCVQIQREDPKNPKASFRKVKAHLELNEFEEAEKEIRVLEGTTATKEECDSLKEILHAYVYS